MNGVIQYGVGVIVAACVTAVFISVFADFYLYNKKKNIRYEKHSIVATGSMTAFYIFYYILMRFNIGRSQSLEGDFFYIQLIMGVVMILGGTAVNILGRIQLKGNWANHIKIYEKHTLITRGVYGYVRHPLYASIILMLYGGCLVFSNWLNAVLTTILFIPAMYYRAKQEEGLLQETFSDYESYKNRVGLFFPKSLRRYKDERL